MAKLREDPRSKDMTRCDLLLEGAVAVLQRSINNFQLDKIQLGVRRAEDGKLYLTSGTELLFEVVPISVILPKDQE